MSCCGLGGLHGHEKACWIILTGTTCSRILKEALGTPTIHCIQMGAGYLSTVDMCISNVFKGHIKWTVG